MLAATKTNNSKSPAKLGTQASAVHHSCSRNNCIREGQEWQQGTSNRKDTNNRLLPTIGRETNKAKTPTAVKVLAGVAGVSAAAEV